MRPVRRVRGSWFAAKPLVAALSAALAVTAFALGASGASADDRFGINAQVLFWSFPQSTWAGHVQLMRQDGIQVVRADAHWEDVEPNAPSGGVHTYNWAPLDAIESTLAANHIVWQPIVDYSAPWAASRQNTMLLGSSPDVFSPPVNNADYAAFAQALVLRYGPNGAFWSQNPQLTPQPVTSVEIWNEENTSGFWQPQPDAAAYAALYTAARSAVHQVAPSVQVMIGGLVPPAAQFLQSIYDALGGASGRIDAVAIHPYASDPRYMYPEVVDTRSVLEQHGDGGVPINVTEFGWPTQGLNSSGYTEVSDVQRAQYIAQFTKAVARSNCGVVRIEPHTWVTEEQSIFNPEDWFGFVHPNLSRSATENAYSSMIGQLAPLATPTPYSTSACSQQLGVAAGTTVQPAPAQPQPLLPLPPLLSLKLQSVPLRAKVARANGEGHGRARIIYGACTQVTVTSAKAPVKNAHVTFRLRALNRTQPPRDAALNRRSDRRGIARACWRSLHTGSGTVTVFARRYVSAPPTTKRVRIHWGPTR